VGGEQQWKWVEGGLRGRKLSGKDEKKTRGERVKKKCGGKKRT